MHITTARSIARRAGRGVALALALTLLTLAAALTACAAHSASGSPTDLPDVSHATITL